MHSAYYITLVWKDIVKKWLKRSIAKCQKNEPNFLKYDILLRRRGNRKETILNRIYLYTTWTNDLKETYWYYICRLLRKKRSKTVNTYLEFLTPAIPSKTSRCDCMKRSVWKKEREMNKKRKISSWDFTQLFQFSTSIYKTTSYRFENMYMPSYSKTSCILRPNLPFLTTLHI